MTAPALDRETVEVLVGPAAWSAHEGLPTEQQVKLDASWEVYQDAYLVAADILEAVCQQARRDNANGSRQLKRLKDGSEELEFFSGLSASAEDADSWCSKAARYRTLAASSVGGGQGAGAFAPLIEPWGVDW